MKFRRSLIFIATLLLVLSVGNAANDFYSHTSGVPATGAQGSSATMRAEFDSIVAGFDKLPTMTANGDETVVINVGGTALTSKNATEMKTLLGLTIGTNIQAYDATLQSISSLGTATDKMAYTTGADTWAETGLTAAGRAILDDADNTAQRATLGLGSMSTQVSNNVSITGGSISGITGLASSGANTDIDSLDLDSGQIKFPASQNPSADVNTLDDYEEGTWTPSIGGSATYTVQAGRYIKIGRLVFVFCSLGINSLGTGSTFAISGLPFNVSYGGGVSVYNFTTIATAVVSLYGAFGSSGVATIGFSGATAASVNSGGTVNIFGNSTALVFSGLYYTDA
jgi:hypothetical protein